MKFKVKLAEVNIEINSIYEEVFILCKDYLSDGKADFCISVSENDIIFEREKAKREAVYEGIPYTDFRDSYLETLAVYRKIAVKLLDFGAFLMHGAVVGLGKKAYLFTAPSGTGKTTHAKFWLEQFPNAFIINGDKPLLKFKDGKVYAFGTPWAGKEGANTNTFLPLYAICALTRGKDNAVTPLEFNQILPLLLEQTYRPSDKESIKKTMSYIRDLGKSVRFFSLHCNLDKTAANIAFDGMNK